jgi:putative flippase GtrA
VREAAGSSSPRKSILSQFLRFGTVGVVGFLVDAGVLMLLLRLTSAGLYASRVVSFLSAATVTWFLNRTFTFDAGSRTTLAQEWFRFICANAIGGLLNFGVYSALVSFSRLFNLHPALAVAAGSLAGLGVNFGLSRAFIFRPESPPVA